ncbi:MAG: CBS domain-containing protein [Nitrospirae bacterium]|nr:CBS domain-containing protein [Nitrospirota bacterium]
MEIITSHSNTDFDALAAMIAARKLYPEAKMIFPGTQEINVRNFISENQIEFINMKEIQHDEVTRLIIVDNKNAGRLTHVSELLNIPNISVHIYDHHPFSPGDLRGEVEVIEAVGAATTLLVEILRDKEIEITPFEATLFAIAIYEETGSFTFQSTTQRDILAAAFLLSCGLNLRTLSRYMVHEMDAEQIALLDELIHNAKTIYIDGVKVVIAKGTTDKYVSELSTITHRVQDMENLDVLFVIVRMEDKIQLVARGRLSEIDLGAIARYFGGGGHATAASASIKDLTTIQVEEKILELLRETIKPFKTARDIMTTPVKTISNDLTIKEAGDLMTRYSVNVLPVIEGDSLIGLIYREIIHKAIFHKFGEVPVTDFMSTEFEKVTGDTPFREIESSMIEHNQRFMPVVEGDRVIGAITRTDILRALHEDISRPWLSSTLGISSKAHERNLRVLLKERLPANIEKLLMSIGEAADSSGVHAYAVGGFVRDLLFGYKNYDIDIVIEGNGIEFAEKFAADAGARVKCHQKFGTAVIIFPDGFKIDVATARTEYYEYPTALPKVEVSSLKKDLYRRDFTINTLAIKLNGPDFGFLIDYFGGQRDIKERTIRVLHNLSFIEDPTRIYRAIRFEQRFGLRIARHTQSLIKSTAKIDLFHRLSGKRLFAEIVLLLSEDDPAKSLSRLSEFDLLRFIHPSLQWDDRSVTIFESINDALAWYRLLFLDKKYDSWKVCFFGFIDQLSCKATEETCLRLEIRERLLDEILSVKKDTPDLTQKLLNINDPSNSMIYELLNNHSQEQLLYLMARTEKDDVKKFISIYLDHLQDVKLFITGKDIVRLGVKPGPVYTKALNQTLSAKLDGIVKTRDEELEFLKGIIIKDTLQNSPCV